MATPSLYIAPDMLKAGKLYSQLPPSGAGDFTVVRNTTATRVNASGLLESVAANVPRIDYTGGGCGSLLVEPAATNSEPNSNVFSVESAPVATVVQNQVDIFGNPNSAWLMSGASTSDDSSTANNVRVITSTPSQISCVSIYVKSPDGNPVTFRNRISGVSPIKSTVVSGSDWVRVFEVSATALTSVRSIFFTSGGAPIIMCQVQVEAGSVPTSLIPTSGTTVTRNADVISLTSASALIGQTEGTIYIEMNLRDISGARRAIGISDGTSANRMGVTISNMSLRVFKNANASVITSSAFPLGTHKVALGYTASEIVFYIDGTLIGTSATSGSGTYNRIDLGQTELNATQLNDRITTAALYPTRLTNAELAALTTL